MDLGRTTAIVAFRDDSVDGYRARLWEFIRRRLEFDHPEFEIVVGTDDGEDPFWKTLALNRAAERATGDVLYLLDSDTYVPPEQVRTALGELRAHPGRWWRPWTRKVKLGPLDTERILNEGPEDWTGTHDPRLVLENQNTYWAAPPFLISRELWDSVGGMDERFRGWGQEDDAFAYSLRSLHGAPQVVKGLAIHLNHRRIGRSGRDLWAGQDSFGPNLALGVEYRRVWRDRNRMRELIDGRQDAARRDPDPRLRALGGVPVGR